MQACIEFPLSALLSTIQVSGYLCSTELSVEGSKMQTMPLQAHHR